MTSGVAPIMERREFRVTLDEEGFADAIETSASESCEILGEYPCAGVGWKRYGLRGGDGRNLRVSVGVELRHVVTIMKYLPGFKLRVPVRNLDMRHQSDLKIVLDMARKNGLFIYVIDRCITLCTILILTVGNQGDATIGPHKMLLFLLLKLIILVYEVGLNVRDLEDRSRTFSLGRSLLAGDSFVWLMQSLTLLVLLLGHSEVERIPSPIAAVLGIFITALTMLTMNWRSFGEMVNDYSAVVADRAVSLKKRLAFYAHRARERISRLRFLEKYRSRSGSVHALFIEGIDFVTPEFGLFMNGRVEVEESESVEEKRKCAIEKRLYYHTVSRREFPHYYLESPRDLARYEGDIKSRLAMVVGPGQLRSEEGIGDLAVTVQVVNHAENPSLCAAEMDSYFSLYYPPRWRSEVEGRDRREVNAVARRWLYQVVWECGGWACRVHGVRN